MILGAGDGRTVTDIVLIDDSGISIARTPTTNAEGEAVVAGADILTSGVPRDAFVHRTMNNALVGNDGFAYHETLGGGWGAP